MRATYSPEDNKLRLYSESRLDPETYAQVKANGFIWAPKQGFFVAPMWTPTREDLLIELCGEIEDEDTSLVERAEERSDRFSEYGESRLEDANRAHKAVSAIADNIPLGQPILIGHHSERRARKDAEKIENGMRKAVNLWNTSKYWNDRAAGAIRHAKYKELPAVRSRRIKGLEADKRKHERSIADSEKWLKHWITPGLTREKAAGIANYDHCYVKLEDGKEDSLWSALTNGKIEPEKAAEIKISLHEKSLEWNNRWVEHLNNRLNYERAMLAASGGIVTDRTKPEKGGACKCWASPGYGTGWAIIQKVNKISVSIYQKTNYGDKYYSMTMPFDKLKAVMSAADVQQARSDGRLLHEDKAGFYLAGTGPTEEKERGEIVKQPEPEKEEAAKFEGLESALKAGIKTVSAPQLFPTPKDLARKLVDLGDVQPGMKVLEPSAGTGNLIKAIVNKCTGFDCVKITAVEINYQLVKQLEESRDKWLYANENNYDIRCSDFLSLNGELGLFDRIIMNPPFENAIDIKHILHALDHLKPGGRLAAICANGPRQREKLQPIATEWIDLEPGAFKESGTSVNAAIVIIDKEKEAKPEITPGQLQIF